MLGLLKKLVFGVLIVAFIISGFVWYKLQPQAVMTINEVIPDDEAQQVQRAVENFKNVIDEFNDGEAHRGAHAKAHGCVKAYFNINNDLPAKFKHGIFTNGEQSYKAWIRFSNGTPRIADDTENDSRGIAIKLLDVTQHGQTQEFLLHNSPAFFSINLEDYNQLVESPDKINYFLPGYNPFNWRLRELSHVLDTLAPPPASPLVDDYFSNTAYKLGPHNVKYKVSACGLSNTNELEHKDPNFLQHSLASELKHDEACLQFQVQLQRQDKLMPIEDPSVLWKEDDSPYISVATIRIPEQDFSSDAQHAFCENLAFSPWNSLEAHRPIGALNRVRKWVYDASSVYRHTLNSTETPQNLAW
jgi:catalase